MADTAQPAGEGVGDPRFFPRTGPHSAAVLAERAGAELRGDGARLLSGVAPIGTAGPAQVSFLDNRRYVDQLAATAAGAIILHPDLASRTPPGAIALVTTEPYAAWARIAALFHPRPASPPGIHPSAVIDPTARIDPTASIGPLCAVGPGADIGSGCIVAAGVVIGNAVQMGEGCRIGAGCSISHALLGHRVNILPGARIGQEGFGFATTDTGFLSVPQLGRVIVGDDVEIGANVTVDRGSATDTIIGAGSRIDNLVQIGHNVQLGRCCVVIAQAGISGSTVLEDFVVVAAQAGVTGHLRIGAKARIGAQAGVMGDVPPGADVVGSPSEPVRDFFRGVATLRKLARRPKGGATAASQAAPATD